MHIKNRKLRVITFNIRMKLVKLIAPSIYEKCKALQLTEPRYKRDYGKLPRPSTIIMKELFQNQEISGVEVGVLRGYNSKSLLKELNIKMLYLVDLWNSYEGLDHKYQSNNDYEIVKNKFKDYTNVYLIKEWSHKASKLFLDNTLDFCYIDANHQYEFVLRDIHAWYSKVKPYGIIAGHDVFSHLGVLKAVRDFCKVKGIKYYIRNPDFYFIKPE